MRNKKAQEQTVQANAGVYPPANQAPTLHEGLNLGHECRFLPPLWCSIIHCWGGCSLCTVEDNSPSSSSLSPSLYLCVTQTHKHINFAALSASGFKAQLWRIHCDSTGFRAQRQRERKRGRWRWGREKRMVWRRRQMNQRGENSSSGRGINITASLVDIIDCIRGSFVNHLLPPYGPLDCTATQD